MPTNVPQFTLNDGTRIPAIGLGCWMGTPGGGERVYDMVTKAIKIGYRHFDTAAGYANEEQVGKAIRDSGIPRSEFYITTKLANTDHHRVAEAFAESLHKLNNGYLDLYLMHWPQATVEGRVLAPEESPTIVETWKEMEKLLASGKYQLMSIKTDTHFACSGRPSGDNIGVINDPTVVKIAERLGVDPAQILLSWAVHKDIIVVPKTENEARLRTNVTLVSLGSDDLETIDAIHTEPGKHRSLLGYHNTLPGTVFGWTYEQMGWDMTKGGIVASRT
ncbi:hypothetical protein AAF712_000481 [Marasmius tenuissimus]|uniref:NADP-dependent oxidoreductase domain-containing protein n=1 Tax=Marasmius tenuissimus TaxID=585030 RepID=A0ABR3AG44_9AGAR